MLLSNLVRKMSIVPFSLLISLSCAAGPRFAEASPSARFVEIEPAQLPLYKKAVLLALGWASLNCHIEKGMFLDSVLANYINKAERGQIDRSGVQPILVFATYTHSQEKVQTLVYLTTSSDFKNIVRARAEEFTFTDVNRGDLKDPNITKGYALRAVADCR